MTGLMVSMLAFVAGVKDKLESEKGATATEYGLLVGLIALILVGGVSALRRRPERLLRPARTTRWRLVDRPSHQVSTSRSAASAKRGRGTFH